MIIVIIVIIDTIGTINTINTIGTIGAIISISLRGIGKAEAERLAKRSLTSKGVGKSSLSEAEVLSSLQKQSDAAVSIL